MCYSRSCFVEGFRFEHAHLYFFGEGTGIVQFRVFCLELLPFIKNENCFFCFMLLETGAKRVFGEGVRRLLKTTDVLVSCQKLLKYSCDLSF